MTTAIYEEEVLSEEQLEHVSGGIPPALVIAGITILINRGLSDADKIRDLVNSSEYKAMSNDDRNKKLGKQLANSWGLCGIIAGLGGFFGTAAVAYEQYEWRTSGTANGLREAIEKMF